jgi:hypothetical protein
MVTLKDLTLKEGDPTPPSVRFDTPSVDLSALAKSLQAPRYVNPLQETNETLDNAIRVVQENAEKLDSRLALLEASVKLLRKPHWTLTPAFLVAFSALLLALPPYYANIYTVVVRGWSYIVQLW